MSISKDDFKCRVCQRQNNLRMLFKTDNLFLLKMLTNVAKISVKPNDKLPKCICSKCVEQLLQAYNFKKQCERTDFSLRMKLGEVVSTYSEIPVKAKRGKRKSNPEHLQDTQPESVDDDLNQQFMLGPIDHPAELETSDQLVASLYECRRCGLCYSQAISLQKHFESHTLFKCDICGLWFKTVCDLMTHEKTHLFCTVCSKQYSDWKSLHDHLQQHVSTLREARQNNDASQPLSATTRSSSSSKSKPSEPGQFECGLCSKTFQYVHTMRAHMNLHINQCSVCLKHFLNKEMLADHMKRHDKIPVKVLPSSVPLKSSKSESEGSSRSENNKDKLSYTTGDEPNKLLSKDAGTEPIIEIDEGRDKSAPDEEELLDAEMSSSDCEDTVDSQYKCDIDTTNELDQGEELIEESFQETPEVFGMEAKSMTDEGNQCEKSTELNFEEKSQDIRMETEEISVEKDSAPSRALEVCEEKSNKIEESVSKTNRFEDATSNKVEVDETGAENASSEAENESAKAENESAEAAVNECDK